MLLTYYCNNNYKLSKQTYTLRFIIKIQVEVHVSLMSKFASVCDVCRTWRWVGTKNYAIEATRERTRISDLAGGVKKAQWCSASLV